MSKDNHIPRVGLGVFVVKDGKFLMGKRKGSHGEGTWALPGGHLEFGESWEECARREVEEETGLRIGNISFQTATNDIFQEENKHYITIFMMADYQGGEPQIQEPEKCEEWRWFDLKDYQKWPDNLFLPLKNLKAESNL